MRETSNYKLSQWDKTDRIEMEDFNSDNEKTDAALKTLAGQVAGKANSSTVSSLTTMVNAKANASALTAEQTARENADATERAAREAADTQLRSENCWVKLADITLSQDTSAYSLQVSQASEYAELRCLLSAETSGGTYISLNGGQSMITSENKVTTKLLIMGYLGTHLGGTVQVLPLDTSNIASIQSDLSALLESRDSFSLSKKGSVFPNLVYSDLRTLDFSVENGVMKAGSHLRLYGLKK